MKIIVLFLTCVLGVPCAGPLTGSERSYAMSQLHATRKLFLDSVAGLSPAQQNFRPGDGRWTIAEIAEHIALSEDLIFALHQKAMAGPAEAKHPDFEEVQKKVEAGVVDRSNKAKAPEMLQPSGKFASVSAAADHFKQRRDQTIAYIEKSPDDMRTHFATHPVFGKIGAYTWLLLLSGHTERHVMQINEVKQAPNFPKK